MKQIQNKIISFCDNPELLDLCALKEKEKIKTIYKLLFFIFAGSAIFSFLAVLNETFFYFFSIFSIFYFFVGASINIFNMNNFLTKIFNKINEKAFFILENPYLKNELYSEKINTFINKQNIIDDINFFIKKYYNDDTQKEISFLLNKQHLSCRDIIYLKSLVSKIQIVDDNTINFLELY